MHEGTSWVEDYREILINLFSKEDNNVEKLISAINQSGSHFEVVKFEEIFSPIIISISNF